MNTTAELIKRVRVDSNLTQKEFAKKFFITEKTVSNYENGNRTPTLDFIKILCKEFNLSLDYFMLRAERESNPKDLIISEKNRKYAIYDSSQSIYLTQHIYDGIILSDYGHHIVYKAHDFVNDEGHVLQGRGDMYYSAIVDNQGNIKEFDDILFGYLYYPFYENVNPAELKSTGKIHLVTSEGKIISNGYKQIRALSSKENNLGLYFGLDYPVIDDRAGEETKRVLIYKDGTEIELPLRDHNLSSYHKRYYKLDDLLSIEKCAEMIKAFGPNIIEIIPNEVFKNFQNYDTILHAVYHYSNNNGNNTKFIIVALSILSEIADRLNPSPSKEKLIPPDLEMIITSRIEKNYILKQLHIFYEKFN